MNKEKAISIISKLLKTAEDKGATENEAMTAALRAQELMAKYDLSITDIEEEKDTIDGVSIETGTGHKWKYSLAITIANNFCCRVYRLNTTKLVFYGFKKNADVAGEVFKFLYNVGNRLANRLYANNYNNGMNTKGVRNTFLVGYVEGIQSVLEKQCRALMLVVPKEVDKSYENLKKKQNMKTTNTCTRYNGSDEAYEKGYTAGRNTAQSRYIED